MHCLRLGKINNKTSTLLIFDRDGTLNIDNGYSFRLEELKLTPFAQCIKRVFQEYNFSAAIASNQSGIARNYFGDKDFDLFTESLVNILDPNRESFFLAVACPHLPEENCNCRKPRTALLESIIQEKDFTNVLMVGNSYSDQLAAHNANMMYLDCNQKNACKKLQDWVGSRCDRK
jgi:histidinol-phosphate phosphatase family protein